MSQDMEGDTFQERTHPVGRPTGSGAQLPAAERNRKSRQTRATAGATRLDITLNPPVRTSLPGWLSIGSAAPRKRP